MDRDRLAPAAADPSIRPEYRGDRNGEPRYRTHRSWKSCTAQVRDGGSAASVARISLRSYALLCVSVRDRTHAATSYVDLLAVLSAAIVAAQLQHPGWGGFDVGFFPCS